jgi:hypothetical protein
MKMSKVIVAALVGMSFVAGAWAAPKNATPVSPEATAKPTEYYGTIEVTVEIHEKSAIASTTPVYCTVDLSVSAYESVLTPGLITSAEEHEAVPTTFSGGKATCTVKVPYFWDIVAPAETLVYMTVGAYAGNSSDIGTVLGRSSTRTISGFAIPSVGATTAFAYAIYL